MRQDTVSFFKIGVSFASNQCFECPNTTRRPEFITSKASFPLYFAPNSITHFVKIFNCFCGVFAASENVWQKWKKPLYFVIFTY